MAEKISLTTLGSLENANRAITVINDNFEEIGIVIDTLLSRDGVAPNHMLDLLDMNEQMIINLPAPTTPTEPARHGDINAYTQAAIDAAEAAQDALEQVIEIEEAFASTYLGSFPADPVEDIFGNPVKEGALYFNTVTQELMIYAERVVAVLDVVVFSDTDEVHVDGWSPVPAPLLSSLEDVDLTGLQDGDTLKYRASDGKWVRVPFTAAGLPFDDGVLVADNVQDAIDEVVTRTVLDQYDIQFYLQGLMSDGESLYKYTSLRPFTIPSDTTGFVAKSGVAATASTVIRLLQNGVQFGTITFGAAATTGTWSVPGDTVFNPNDIMTLAAPTVPDISLRDVTVGIIARR